MIIKVTQDTKEHEKYICKDMNTGYSIPCVQYANDETGEIRLYLRDEEGNLFWNEKKQEYVLFTFFGNIKLVKKEGE